MSMMTLGVAFVSVTLLVSAVGAETITSPSYKINGNLGGSFGGQTSSTNYKMSAIGGEAIVGNGQSGSYIIDQSASISSAPAMQLDVQPSGLKAYYPLDENTGTASKDGSVNSNNGTIENGPTWTTGKLGSALHFDRLVDSQSFSVPYNSAITMGSNMTLSLWAYQDELWSGRTIASRWDRTGGSTINGGWILKLGATEITKGRIIFAVANSPTDDQFNYVSTPNGTWSANSWHHVVVVYDGTQETASQRVKIYLDGVAKTASMTGTIPASMQDPSTPLMLGGLTGDTASWNGDIDHVKIFNRSLSISEIKAEYDAQASGVPTGLTLGTLSGPSTTSSADAIVRTNSSSYGLSVQQDHDLQSGVNTIPAVAGTIASPATWVEGVTEGFGFTVTAAPTLDGKWGAGSKFAALPSSVTTFYNETNHIAADADVVSVGLRLDISATQPSGAYANNVIYTGTTLP